MVGYKLEVAIESSLSSMDEYPQSIARQWTERAIGRILMIFTFLIEKVSRTNRRLRPIPNPEGIEYRRLSARDTNPEVIKKIILIPHFDPIPNPAGIEYRRLLAPDANPEVRSIMGKPSFKPQEGLN